jgi:hypothetical protein
LVGKNTNGENLGDALEFRTGEAVNLETNQPTVVTATSARLNGSITPEGAEIEECVFEWGPQQTPFVNTTPCAESSLEIGTGSEPKAVHANLTGLEVGKSYLFRLRAKNHFGTRRGNEVYFSALGPGILGESASGSDTTVTATACIASRGEETSYVVEYVSDAEFAGSGYANAQSVPIGGKVVEENCTVTQQIAGLTPATKYHLRFAATSAAGTAHGEDTVFSTLRSASAGLPDGRAYEQVSPPSKNGSNVQGDYLNILYASPNGDANTFYSGSGAGETESSQALPIYASSRGTSNWSTEGINPPSSLGARLRILTYKEDLSGSYAITWEARGAATLYLREKGGHLVKIASGLKLGAGLDEEKVGGAPERTNIAAESAGGSEVLFESPVKLAEGAIEGQLQQEGRPLIENLYIWDRGTGGIDLVSVLPGGTPAPEGATAGSYNWANGGAGGATGAYLTKDTLSQDGGVAVFTTMDSSHQIYARRDPLSATATTVHVSASQKTNGAGPGGTDPLGPAAAVYEGMTPDGHYIFFKSSEELTNDAYTGPADEGEDLYRYDVNSGQLTDVAPHPSGKGTDVLGIAGFSNDGSVVYLVAQGALATGGTVGAPNIYAVEGGTVRFVSTLGGSNAPDRENWIGMGILSAEVLIQKQSKVSNDGNDLLFTSTKSNPGYDSNGFTEVYRYELSSESLNCMSCNPAGFKATSGASLQAIPTPFVSAETWNPLGTRNLSADGKRAFFDTREALLSSDINGVNDVYEWEADGSGSCHSTADNGGCLFLVSSGTSPSASYFSDASASGDDVFFLTAQKLVGQDKDELVDSYDARVGGGLAAQNPPPPNPCSGEACLGSAGTAPAAQSPGSANFSGPENPKPSHKKKHQKKKKKSRNKSHGKSKAKHGQSGGHR